MLDLYALGSSLVDTEFLVQPQVVERLGMTSGSMVMASAEQQRERIASLSALGLQPQNHCGGSAVNTLITATAMGASGALATRLADDANGGLFLQNLREGGVDCDPAMLDSGATGSCVVLVTSDAERSMSTDLGVSADFAAEDIDFSRATDASYVYAEGYLAFLPKMVPALCDLAKLAQQQSRCFALSLSDPSVVQGASPALEQILQTGAVGLLFGNEQEFVQLTGTDSWQDAEAVLREQRQVARYTITLGAQGVVTGESAGARAEVAGESVRAMDTLGAGDCFAGAFLYALTLGADMAQAAGYANTCAAELVQLQGPRLSPQRCHALAASHA